MTNIEQFLRFFSCTKRSMEKFTRKRSSPWKNWFLPTISCFLSMRDFYSNILLGSEENSSNCSASFQIDFVTRKLLGFAILSHNYCASLEIPSVTRKTLLETQILQKRQKFSEKDIWPTLSRVIEFGRLPGTFF